MRFNNVIFDLDGTLVQSLEGIQASAQVALSLVMPGEVLPDLRPLIGPPLELLFTRLWPGLSAETMARLMAEFRAHYDTRGFLLSRPYPQVPEVLSRLHRSGARLFVLTNKPAAPARQVLEHVGLVDLFIDVVGSDSAHPPFRTKLDAALMLARKHDLASDSTTLVGDGADDAVAASGCGFRFIAVEYGYGTAASEASVCASQFSEIEHLLLVTT
jgi:phosphoglycolate phosphatase